MKFNPISMMGNKLLIVMKILENTIALYVKARETIFCTTKPVNRTSLIILYYLLSHKCNFLTGVRSMKNVIKVPHLQPRLISVLSNRKKHPLDTLQHYVHFNSIAVNSICK